MFNPFTTNIGRVERDNTGGFFYEFLNSKSKTSAFKNEQHKLNTVLNSPAFLTVVKIQCDMFTLGNVKAVRNEKDLPNDALLQLLERPNPFQTDRQFLWDYMLWRMLGTAYLHTSSKILKDSTQLYWLNPANLVWTDKLCKQLDKVVLSNGSLRELEKLQIEYKYNDNSSKYYSLAEIKPFFDLTNGTGNWYKGVSAVDALYKIILNSETGLDAKFSNLDFAGKFTVTGKSSMDNIDDVPMGDVEQQDAKSKLKSKDRMHVLKTPIEISRFVEDLRKLELDKAFFADVFIIAKMYNIPKGVIEDYFNNNSIFGENKSEIKADWIDESIKPQSEDLMNGLEALFGYHDRNIDLVMDYSHLSFMQVREKQRQEGIARQINNIQIAVNMEAISKEDATAQVKEILGYE